MPLMARPVCSSPVIVLLATASGPIIAPITCTRLLPGNGTRCDREALSLLLPLAVSPLSVIEVADTFVPLPGPSSSFMIGQQPLLAFRSTSSTTIYTWTGVRLPP